MENCFNKNIDETSENQLEKYARIAESAWDKIMKYSKSDNYLVVKGTKSELFIDKHADKINKERIVDINLIYTFKKKIDYENHWQDLVAKIKPWREDIGKNVHQIVSEHPLLNYFSQPEVLLAEILSSDMDYNRFLALIHKPDRIDLELRSIVDRYDEIVCLFGSSDVSDSYEMMCIGNHYFEHLTDTGVCYFVEEVKNRYDDKEIKQRIDSCLDFCSYFKTRLVHKFLPQDYFVIEGRKKRL